MTNQHFKRKNTSKDLKQSTISCSTLFGFLSFVIFGILTYLLEKNFIPIRKQGFFCNDASIAYPYEEATISGGWLFGINFIVSITLFTIGEKVFSRQALGTCEEKVKKWNNLLTILRSSNKLWYMRTLKLFISLTWCLCSTIMVTAVIKTTVGSLRPYFLSVCEPNITCLTNNHTLYNAVYICQGGKNEKAISEARRSFPSGHSSFSAAVMAFNILYIKHRYQVKDWQPRFFKSSDRCLYLRPFLQICLISIATFIAVTRISDHHHHIIDVLVGFLLGTVIGLLVGKPCMKWLKDVDEGVCFKEPFDKEFAIKSESPIETTGLNENSDSPTKDQIVVINEH